MLKPQKRRWIGSNGLWNTETQREEKKNEEKDGEMGGMGDI